MLHKIERKCQPQKISSRRICLSLFLQNVKQTWTIITMHCIYKGQEFEGEETGEKRR